MSIPALPQEILLQILQNFIETDDELISLVRCAQVSKSWRQAASTPYLWEQHYKRIYRFCNQEREAARREALSDNWYLLYTSRSEIDRDVLARLAAIEGTGSRRRIVDEGRAIVSNLGMDAWDALKHQSLRPGPVFFDEDEDCFTPLTRRRTTLSRKRWAKELMGVMARRHSVSRWMGLLRTQPDEHCPTLEEAFACLSAFFDVHPDEVRLHDVLYHDMSNVVIHLLDNGGV